MLSTTVWDRLCQPEPLVMGVVNVTPDSFSDGGRYTTVLAIRDHIHRMVVKGADIVDIGAESTRPYALPVSPDEEKQRLSRAFSALQLLPRHIIEHTLISLDTTKAMIAEWGIQHGVHIINDVSALCHDPNMIHVVARRGIPVVLMHRQGSPQTMQDNPHYPSGVTDMIADMDRCIKLARRSGIHKIVVDPELGLAKP